jgi:phosphosulfolactate synthase
MEDLVRALGLPSRPPKPRQVGLTIAIDGGLSWDYALDLAEDAGEFIDLWKLGWGTALVTRQLDAKVESLRRQGIDVLFGGTLFEKFAVRGMVGDYWRFCRDHGCRYVEVSNGTISMSNREKAGHVAELSQDFLVLSEVGYKDPARSALLSPGEWTRAALQDLQAGAYLVLIEARESGRSGICDERGELRIDVLEEIERSGIAPANLVFEAPTKDLQTRFIRRFGPNVNLGNIAPGDAIGVETLRLGLRSDTFDLNEGGAGR